MFEARVVEKGRISFLGRLDAAQVEKAQAALEDIGEELVIDFAELEYISSAGLGVLIALHRRLSESETSLKLINMKDHIRYIFHLARLDTFFEIE